MLLLPLPSHSVLGLGKKRKEVYLYSFGGGRGRNGCSTVGKYMMNFRFLFASFKNKVFLFSYCPFITSLSSPGFLGKTLLGHSCLSDSMYGTVILMSLFQNHLYTKSFHEWLPYNFSTLIVNG